MSEWVLVLGCSTGHGGAVSKHLAAKGYGILGFHFDRGEVKAEADSLKDEISELNDGRVYFWNKNAASLEIMDQYIPEIEEITKGKALKLLLHSIAFGTTTNFFGEIPVTQKQMDMTIMVENHGGHSGNGLWVADVMERVALDNCGTLPDFQNFKAYDPYKGVKEMMPYAKAVCAKAKAFDAQGNESNVDYARMMGIVKDAGFSGYIGIEYEGHDPAPVEGILATKRLLEKVW